MNNINDYEKEKPQFRKGFLKGVKNLLETNEIPLKNFTTDSWKGHDELENKFLSLKEGEIASWLKKIDEYFEKMRAIVKRQDDFWKNYNNLKSDWELRHKAIESVNKALENPKGGGRMYAENLDDSPSLWHPYPHWYNKMREIEIGQVEIFKNQMLAAIEKESKYWAHIGAKGNKFLSEIRERIVQKLNLEKVTSDELNASFPQLWKTANRKYPNFSCGHWEGKLLCDTRKMTKEDLEKFEREVFIAIEKTKKKKNEKNSNEKQNLSENLSSRDSILERIERLKREIEKLEKENDENSIVKNLEIKEKKNELSLLEERVEKLKTGNNLKKYLIGGGIILVILCLLSILIKRNKNKKR